MEVTSKKNTDGSIEITISLSAIDVKCLKHNLIGDQGIIEWFSIGPSREKIANCRSRMIKENEFLIQTSDAVKNMTVAEYSAFMMNEDQVVEAIVSHKDYKDRETREAESKQRELDEQAAREAAL